MGKRLIGSAIVLGVAIPCLWLGGIVFNIFAFILAGLAIFELINASKDLRKIPSYIKAISLISLPIVVGLNISASLYVGVDFYTLLIPVIILMGISLFTYKKGYGMNEAFKLSMISLFVSFICLTFISICKINRTLLIYLIIIAMATDVFAYVGGKLIGKHKFTKISPNKTIEGCVIGAIVGTILSFIYYIKFLPVSNGVLIFAITLLLSIVGEMGDLIFSLIKRENDIKDYSKLIPGHGGVCDRLDSLSFIVLVFVILFKFI